MLSEVKLPGGAVPDDYHLGAEAPQISHCTSLELTNLPTFLLAPGGSVTGQFLPLATSSRWQ